MGRLTADETQAFGDLVAAMARFLQAKEKADAQWDQAQAIVQPAPAVRTASVKDNPKRLLTRREAAELLGVTHQTLAVWHVTGRYNLPVVKVGRSARYRLSDLERWLASRTIIRSQT